MRRRPPGAPAGAARGGGVVRPVAVGAARGPPQRGRDAHAGGDRGVRQRRGDQGRHGLRVLGELATTWWARPSASSWPSTPWGCGRPCARATWRWTGPGPCTRRGRCCRRARSTPPSSTASGGRRRRQLDRVLALQLDPYYMAPLWPDPVALAALQAQALIDAGSATEADFAAVAARSRRDALGNPNAQVTQGPVGRGAAAPTTTWWPRCGATPCRPSPTGPRPSSWPPGTGPGRCASGRRGSRAWTTASRPTPSGPAT